MKKIVVLLMAVILLLLLAVCHQKNEKAPDTAEPSETVETVPPQEEQNQTDAQNRTEDETPEPNKEGQTTTIPAADPAIVPAEYCGAWYDEKLPYNELELNSDGTYSSALFGVGTFRVEDDTIILHNGGTEYTLQTFPDEQRLSYNNICYIRTPYPIPEVFLEELGESEGIFITISFSECDSAEISRIAPTGEEIPEQDKGERALHFSAIVQDLNTYPWYDGNDILIFGGFYADNGFVSSVTKTYTPFKIIAIKFDPGENQGAGWISEERIGLKTEDGTVHDMRIVYQNGTMELTSDLFEGHVFRVNHYAGHKEPNITH